MKMLVSSKVYHKKKTQKTKTKNNPPPKKTNNGIELRQTKEVSPSDNQIMVFFEKTNLYLQ